MTENTNQSITETAAKIVELKQSSAKSECVGTQISVANQISQLLENFDQIDQEKIKQQITQILQTQ